MINALTIDVEDYYHVSGFNSVIKFADWENLESRLDISMGKILKILSHYGVKATFFVLGWVAEKFPTVVKAIHQAGHEIASHSYAHRLIYDQTPDEFQVDMQRSLEVIHSIIGKEVIGYRAPSFSITKQTLWALDIMQNLGIIYDSSVFPTHHDRYGIPDAPVAPYEIRPGLWEFPITTVQVLGYNFPVGGGGYMRLYPYLLTRWGIQRVNSQGRPAVVYVHPWELDPDQPKIENVSLLNRFRHYQNLDKTEARLRALLRDFKFAPMGEVLTDWRDKFANQKAIC